jgi:serine/threonine protein phosphatase PrpC
MNPLLPVASAGLTDRGLQREHNEDGFLCEPELGLFAVADGLGGLPCGELASRLALDELVRLVRALPRDAAPDWQDIFDRINRIVLAAGREISETLGIGTTLTVVRALPGRLHLGHVGDSGLFAFPAGGKAAQLTRDHTMAQEMLDAHGPSVAASIPESYHHTLTQCIGQPVPLVVETLSIPVSPGTRFVLYTDGVTKTQELPELAGATFVAQTPKDLVGKIVELANSRGGPDNVTAVALYY